MQKRPLLVVLQVVPVLILARSVYFDLSARPLSVAMFSELGMNPVGRILVGVLELGCVVLLLIPELAIYGAILGLGIMLGALIAHLTVVGVSGEFLVPFLLSCVTTACCAAIIYLRRTQVPAIRDMFE